MNGRSPREIQLEQEIDKLEDDFEELNLQIEKLVQDGKEEINIIRAHSSRLPSDDPALMNLQQLNELYNKTVSKQEEARFKLIDSDKLKEKIDELKNELQKEQMAQFEKQVEKHIENSIEIIAPEFGLVKNDTQTKTENIQEHKTVNKEERKTTRWNPFDDLSKETILQSSYWDRVQDTFEVFFGDPLNNRLGILDYFLPPIERLLGKAAYHLLHKEGILSFAAGMVLAIPYLILNIIKIMPAVALTFITLPFITIVHLLAKINTKQKNPQMSDIIAGTTATTLNIISNNSPNTPQILDDRSKSIPRIVVDSSATDRKGMEGNGKEEDIVNSDHSFTRMRR